MLALQALALGLLATGALGTSKVGKTSASAPLISTAVNVAHDTSVPLTDTPVVANDPNRVLPELERLLPATVNTQTHDPVRQVAAPSVSVPASLGTFNGLKRTDLSTGYVPPDTVGDVGPTQYMQAVNGGLAVFSKDGQNLTGPINDSSFWNGLSGCQPTVTRGLTDPTVNYDQFADRWVYSELSYDTSTTPWGPSYMCIAVSSTGDATDSWYRYVFAVGSGVLTDYPKLGVWPDGYYLSFNDFNSASPHSFVGAGAMVVERSQMLGGASAQSVFVDLRGSAGLLSGGILPSDADGSTAPPGGAPDYYAAAVDDPTDVNDQVGIWAFHADWAVPANSTFTNPQALHVAAYDGNSQLSVPQPAVLGVPSPQLDGLADNRLMNRLQYRNFGGFETLVTNLSVNNGSGGLAPHWWELRKVAGSWGVNQDSTFAPDALNRWVGSVAMDGAGDMALGYSAGDAGSAPSIRYTGRLVSDSLSQMQGESTFAGGGGSQTGTSRWGDYSQMTVDPSDDCTFWYTGEFYPVSSANAWETRISSFRFPSCVTSSGPTYSVSPTVSGTLREGQTLTATSGTWSPASTFTYQWRRCDVNAVSCADIAGQTATTYVLRAADAGLHVRVKVTATANVGGLTSTAVSAATGTILPLAPSNSAVPVVTGTARVAQTLSSTTGTWSSYPSTATTFTYQWERCFVSCGSIPSATGSTYVLAAADAGATVRIGVTAHSIGGTTLAYSVQTGVVTLPPAPANTVAPAISGTAQSGQTLSISQGTWTGAQPIAYSYQWVSCSSTGASCGSISGQTSNTYAVNNGDIGKTLRASVTATNSGGGTVFTTSATSVVTAAPAGGGGGSGGGGGGGAGSPDLAVTGFSSNASPLVGDNVTFLVTVTDKNLKPAQQLYLTVALGSGLQFVTSTSDRGSGCAVVSSSQLSCFLDWLSSDVTTATLQITAKVIATTGQTFSGTASASQGEFNAADNTLSLALNTASTPVAGGTPGADKSPTGLNGDGTPTKTQDKRKPTAEALYTPAKRGAVAKLRFKIYDDQGVAKAVTSVKRGSTVVGTANTGYGPVASGSTYYVGWHVPAHAAKGNYWFCVTAVDRAGNKSAQSCAPLALR